MVYTDLLIKLFKWFIEFNLRRSNSQSDGIEPVTKDDYIKASKTINKLHQKIEKLQRRNKELSSWLWFTTIALIVCVIIVGRMFQGDLETCAEGTKSPYKNATYALCRLSKSTA